MIKIFVNNVDITSSVQFQSLTLTDQLNNRRNTAKFVVNNLAIAEAQKVEIYKGAKLSSNISAGVSSFVLDEIFDKWDFFRIGDTIILGAETANEEYVTISGITPSTKTLATSLTRYAHTKGDLMGKKIFLGVTLKNPREEIGKSDVLTYQVDCTDMSTIFDTHNVVDTYLAQYAREIIGRIVYKYTAPDVTISLNDMENLTGVTQSGTAVTPVLDSTDKIYKNQSIQIGASAAGSAIYKFAFFAIDVSTTDNFRLWEKFPASTANWISGQKVRLISSAGNFYEWTDARLYDALWSYDSFEYKRGTITGTPNLASITAVEVELIATKAIPVGTFKLDHLFCTKGGFTIRGVERGNILFKDVRAQYKKPTILVESLSKNDGFSWYVDTMSDVRYFASENRLAPFNIVAPTGKNYWPLKITADITNLKNRVVVRGGIAPSDFLYTQEKVLDGKETSYRLDYSPKWLNVYLDTGAGYVLKTNGVENLVSDTSVDFVFNFSEKVVRNGAVGLQASGTKIKLEYYPYKDVRVSQQDDVSIATMKALLGGDGIFDGAVINDASLRTFDEARARAKAEIKAYANPVLTATFTSETDGLESWQTIQITDPIFSIDKAFVIQKVDKRLRDNSGIFLSSVQAGTTLYGLTEFFQYLLRMYGTGEIDSAELVDRVQPVNETMIAGEVLTSTKKTNVFYAHSRTWNYDYTLTFTEGGTSNDAYADFCVVS